VKYENPNTIFKDMGTVLKTKWKALNIEETKSCEEKYEDEKKAHSWVNCGTVKTLCTMLYIFPLGFKGSKVRLLKVVGLQGNETKDLKLL